MWLPRDYFDAVVFVDASGPQFKDADMHYLRYLPELKTLTLCNTGVTDIGLLALQQHPELSQLDVPGGDITDTGIAAIETIPKLETLDVRNTRVTRARLVALTKAVPKCGWIDGQDSALQVHLDQRYGPK